MAASWARPDSWTTRQWWSPNAPAPMTATLGCDIGGLPREFLQRRDAENAETSAEKTKHIDGRSPESRAVGRSSGVLGPLCVFLCVLCIAILKNFVILHKFHAALDSSATVACCAADMAVIATRPRSVRR